MEESDKYVGALFRNIRLQPAKKKEIICELEDHLEDKADELVSLGVRQEAAKSLAMEQMGDPITLARLMQDAHTIVGRKELALAVVPHILLIGLVAFGLCDSITAVVLTLGFVGAVTWLSWRGGFPGIWSYSWLGVSLAAPAVLLLMLVIGPGKSFQAMLAGASYPVSLTLIALFGGYAAVALWVITRVVRGKVGHDWLLVAFSGLPLLGLTAWVMVAQWSDPAWRPPMALLGVAGAPWILAFLTMATVTAAFLKFGRRHARVGQVLISTSILVTGGYAMLLVNYDSTAVRLAIVALIAVMLAPALRKPLVSSLRMVQNVLQTTVHLICK